MKFPNLKYTKLSVIFPLYYKLTITLAFKDDYFFLIAMQKKKGYNVNPYRATVCKLMTIVKTPKID